MPKTFGKATCRCFSQKPQLNTKDNSQQLLAICVDHLGHSGHLSLLMTPEAAST